MTKKSKLLQATLLAANESARKNFHENTANYFLMATLEFLKEYKNDKTNVFEKHPLIKAELERVCDLLKIDTLDIDKIIKQISEEMTDPLYLVERDEYSFKKLSFICKQSLFQGNILHNIYKNQQFFFFQGNRYIAELLFVASIHSICNSKDRTQFCNQQIILFI